MPHHKGKINTNFVQNKKQRLKYKNRRIKTLLSKGMELSSMTNCSVFIYTMDELNHIRVAGSQDMLAAYHGAGIKSTMFSETENTSSEIVQGPTARPSAPTCSSNIMTCDAATACTSSSTASQQDKPAVALVCRRSHESEPHRSHGDNSPMPKTSPSATTTSDSSVCNVPPRPTSSTACVEPSQEEVQLQNASTLSASENNLPHTGPDTGRHSPLNHTYTQPTTQPTEVNSPRPADDSDEDDADEEAPLSLVKAVLKLQQDDPLAQVYQAEKITDSRMSFGSKQYFVKWKGWSDKHNTWEPEEHIIDKKLIALFLSQQNKEKEQ
ncbi:Polycomb group protein Pc [Holothuria leucospilota]|uniref:Polycomb group protein Pc n=1 Tax=Holothuria leucospilota TaxID=206669 RepID=A0A9Q1CD17_HOLLE|nr:Polycomb group protein Pc [Holothuria leucospilota]KAJ8042473.1 Polycomb group protein Pc [Holothuria leucospilota]